MLAQAVGDDVAIGGRMVKLKTSKSSTTTEYALTAHYHHYHETNSNMTPKYRPPTHPGVLSRDMLEELELTQVELAKRLGIPLQRLNTIVKGKRGVSADTALRLSKVFGTTPEYWLNLQMAVDLWGAQKDAADLSKLKTIKQKRAA
jgi:antitoxin HigA-1